MRRMRFKLPAWTGRLSGQSACVLVAIAVTGCGKPNAANIALRKQIQDLNAEIVTLKTQHANAVSTIQTLQSSTPTVPALPAERMSELFTVSSLHLGRLSGWVDIDPTSDGDDALKIYVVPLDAAGDELKAAGAFKVEAFDLSAKETRVGEWDFSVDQSRACWNGSGLLYEYVLPCPFKRAVPYAELTIKITFIDALTRRTHTVQKVIKKTP